MSGYASLTSVSVKNNFTCQKKVCFFEEAGLSKVGGAFWLEFFLKPKIEILQENQKSLSQENQA